MATRLADVLADELSEVALLWAARDMLYNTHVALEDLAQAMADARPYGRIFHDNLFRHATEVTRKLHENRKPGRKQRQRGKENPELKEFIETRWKRQVRRIRWRRFDGDGDGRLAAEEIDPLCATLVARPTHVLVTSREEFESATHPPQRHHVPGQGGATRPLSIIRSACRRQSAST